MTDKEKIKAEIERLKESGCASPIVICDTLLAFIDSMQEEPVSDDLEIAACQSFNSACEDLNKEDKDSATYVKEYFKELWMCAFKDGAHWQKQLMMKPLRKLYLLLQEILWTGAKKTMKIRR